MVLYYGLGMGYWDPTYVFVLIGVVLSLVASAKVKMTFAKYSKVRSMSGQTGAEAAQAILMQAGIHDVRIERISGNLTDHYDPTSKTLRLSDTVYNQTSVAAIGVAAHECGHAIQHATNYAPLKFRSSFVPVANIGSKLSWPLIILGMFINSNSGDFLLLAGIVMFSAAVFFQILTLPVEFNASRRAVLILDERGILYGDEVKQTKKVLDAAALTYVAAAAASILQLLRLMIILGGRNRD